MKDFDVANSESLFDFNKPDSRGSNETRGLCYDKAQPGLGFNGSSWARFGKWYRAILKVDIFRQI